MIISFVRKKRSVPLPLRNLLTQKMELGWTDMSRKVKVKATHSTPHSPALVPTGQGTHTNAVRRLR